MACSNVLDNYKKMTHRAKLIFKKLKFLNSGCDAYVNICKIMEISSDLQVSHRLTMWSLVPQRMTIAIDCNDHLDYIA
jgi:hypothetical protein